MIQTRVAEDLEQMLKREAARRRLTVSHLIRNTLEDAFTLVEDVTNDVEQLVTGSVELAAAVGRDARRIASLVRGQRPEASSEESDEAPEERMTRPEPLRAEAPPPPPAAAEETPRPAVSNEAGDDPLAHVYGWNRIVANKPAACAQCTAEIARGDDALVGLSDDPKKPRVWLCADCGEEL